MRKGPRIAAHTGGSQDEDLGPVDRLRPHRPYDPPCETGAWPPASDVARGPQCQQPLQRIVGRRQSPVLNDSRKGPSESLQTLLVELSAVRTRTPKGIFRYATHEEANRDQERWRAAAVVARQSRPESV